MKKLNNNWLVFDDEKSLSKILAQEILTIAKKSILKKDCFNIVLTGGRSAISLYKILSKSNSNWDKWHIYISDERFLPAGHKDRNDKEINKVWLNNSSIPNKNIHFIKAELGLLEAREEYEKELRKINKFDLVLLSMGEDGHVASLFPNHKYNIDKNVVVENNSPKWPKDRITMSYSRLNQTHNVFKIISGMCKQKAVSLWLQEDNNLPFSQIKGCSERIYICEDALPYQ